MLDKFKLSDILLKIIKGGIFFILFLPLVMNSNFFFPFIVPKNVLFRITVEIIFATYLILAHLRPEFRPKMNLLVWSVITFFAIATVTSFTGIDIYSSFWGNYERMSGLFHLWHLLMYFFVLFNVFKHKKDWHSFLTFFIFISSLMAILGLAQWLEVPFLLRSSGGERLSGTVGNATFFAAYLIFNLFFILYFLAKPRRFNFNLFAYSFFLLDTYLVVSSVLAKIFLVGNWHQLNFLKAPILTESFKYPGFFASFLFLQLLIAVVWFFRSKPHLLAILLSVFFIFNFFIFFNTQTRGAIIGFFLGITFLAFVSLFLKADKKVKIVSLVFLLFIIIAPFILVAAKDTSFVKDISTLRRLATISPKNITTESRLLTWQANWKGWTENPRAFLLGYGLENYYYIFNKYFPTPIYKDLGSQIWFDRAHNIIFDLGVTTGFIGLISYLSILFFTSWALFKNYQKDKVISSSFLLIALIVAYFSQNFFVFDTLNTEIPFYLFLAFAIYLFLTKNQKEEKNLGEEKEREVNYIYVVFVVIILFFGIFAINVKTLKANNYLYQGLISKAVTGKYNENAFVLLKKAINEAITGKFESRQQLASCISDFVKSNDKDISPNQTQEIVNYAARELEKSVEEEPLNVRHYLYLSTFYNATTRFNRTNPQKVIELMEKAVQLSPTRPQVYYEKGQAYLFLGDFSKAYENFQKGIELAPWVLEDNFSLLSIYIVSQKDDLADAQFKLMQEKLSWKPGAADYSRLVNLYSRNNNYTKMIEFQTEVVKLEPSASAYAQLAAIYAKIGENQKAREVTQKAVELDPAFASEAEKFLEFLEAGELLEK